MENLWQQHSSVGISKNYCWQGGVKGPTHHTNWDENDEVAGIREREYNYIIVSGRFTVPVSTTHLPVDSVPIGQHPIVKQLFRGVYNSRPPQPRYTQTWDITTVLDHTARLGENRDLSLKQLSLNLVMLNKS